MLGKLSIFKIQNYSLYLLLISICICIIGCSKKPEKETYNGYIQYVDPMIGTDAHAHTFPGATTPFGMVQLSPSNDLKGWDWNSGYHYTDSILKGFAHSHISGAGLTALGDFLLMPTVGSVKIKDGTEEDPDSGFRSRFSHDREEASAGYYSVILDDYDVKVELTASPRVGFHRYTYNQAGKGNIIIDASHQLGEYLYGSGIEFISDNEIKGYKRSNGAAGVRNVYFYAQFSKKFKEKGIAINDIIIPATTSADDKKVKAFVSFDVEAGEQVDVKVAISYVSYEGAKANFDAEAKTKSFDKALVEAQKIWEEKMNKFPIETESVSDLRSFYTAVYRTMISPNLISDVTGEYIVEGKKYHSDFEQYSNFSTWDTYRAQNPLMALVEQEKVVDFVNSLTSRYTDAKVGLPVWECIGFDNVCMIGHNTVSVMADAIVKDLPGIDVESAYIAMRDAAFELDKHSGPYGENGMEYYIEMDFVPASIGMSVSKTTEYNYFDWCIAEVAKKLHKQEDQKLFQKRSKGYRNSFDKETGYLLPLTETGKLLEMDMTEWEGLVKNYISGNIWGYSSYVPHDMGYLMKLHGGKKNFTNWLDNVFADSTEISGGQHVDISGFIGKYGHGDEPSNHMSYLYTFAGEPWKTQKLVREIMPKFYRDVPDGLDNNDDLGQMAAWYVFSSLGFYPVCPGSNQYQIGSPAFKKAGLVLENGKEFVVVANNNSSENIYIQSATLNGEVYTKPFITYNQIISGGELVLEMGNQPNKTWANSDNDLSGMVGMKADVDYNLYINRMVSIPYTTDKELCFAQSKKVNLYCNTEGAIIRYTLDGSAPDINSKVYNAPLILNNETTIKAKAFKEGLEASRTFEATYMKGIMYNPTTKLPKIAVSQKGLGYGSPNGVQLIDGVLGSNSFGDGFWTGINEEDMEVEIDFGSERWIKKVRPGFLVDTGQWIFNPDEIIVQVSSDNREFREVGRVKTNTPSKNLNKRYIERPNISFSPELCRYVKFTFKNKSIPNWHVGSGKNHWIFIDEILVQ
ncbi:GH92 family glycosyl hydrolase [Seonamhaeicola aphaedonensis]|uniref:Putative alpha-1,2-mannosidase n=1 Tax=Seonamhaeicola aphaedonensis TaxID=1461338 RepID=A0A3D9HDD6_9FLAO|nr:GH92 family glycosyl hydrolase [Seonamhaeicola aphaedonensis]RED47484.1 putative alpha-1,2-mannosidase [Seonamhaeicola aphaedonensis]